MPTRPAKQPLTVMPRSGLPTTSQEVTVEVSTAAMAAVLVVTRMCMTSAGCWKLMVEPGLNPNQPSHRTNRPMTASDMLCPGMAWGLPVLSYLPMRGPKISAPARAAQPPTECTAASPAKSIKPRSASQPPPQIQCPTMG